MTSSIHTENLVRISEISNNNAIETPTELMQGLYLQNVSNTPSALLTSSFKTYISSNHVAEIREDINEFVDTHFSGDIEKFANRTRLLRLPASYETDKFEQIVEQMNSQSKTDKKLESAKKEGFEAIKDLQESLKQKEEKIDELMETNADLKNRIKKQEETANKIKGMAKVTGLVLDTVLSVGGIGSGVALLPVNAPLGSSFIAFNTGKLGADIELWTAYGKESMDQAKGIDIKDPEYQEARRQALQSEILMDLGIIKILKDRDIEDRR